MCFDDILSLHHILSFAVFSTVMFSIVDVDAAPCVSEGGGVGSGEG